MAVSWFSVVSPESVIAGGDYRVGKHIRLRGEEEEIVGKLVSVKKKLDYYSAGDYGQITYQRFIYTFTFEGGDSMEYATEYERRDEEV